MHEKLDHLTDSPAPASWHTLTGAKAAAALGVDPASGLIASEVSRRAAEHGPNRLADKRPRPVWLRFVDQFKNLLILVLLVAAGLAAAIGNVKDAVIIFVVLVLNALFGFVQEYRAERSLDALKRMLPPKTHVRRGGTLFQIPAEALVPGDIVVLEAGDSVPADGRLIAAHGLEVDEAVLTGESVPVAKQADAAVEANAALSDRANMLWMNTTVTRGRGEVVITATGMRTAMGRVSKELADITENPTPLQTQLDNLGKRLALTAAVLVGVLFGLDLLRGQPLVATVIEAIALTVAAMPEGLPAVVTVTLALGMQRMARQRAILRRMAAVETLGCTTVICSDKTGTLTLNQMTARAFYFLERHFAVSGEGYRSEGEILAEQGDFAVPDFRPLLLPIALCNDSEVRGGDPVGDPTEAALAVLAAKGGVDRAVAKAALPRVGEIPFDAKHKFMATFHRDGDTIRVFVKGAPDVLVDRCQARLGTAGNTRLDAEAGREIADENRALAARGLRVLTVAVRDLPADRFDPSADHFREITDLTFVSLIGLSDPPRPEARDAIALCQRAGVRVKMITGDQKDTATAIARELGLEGGAVTGAELDGLEDDRRLSSVVESTAVFCRVAPEHKVRIVRALKDRGHIVAMTGDGVNDAPALKAAHIGVAMGRGGSEVAKEAASLVLTDDNFATIVVAIREGRALYANIVKFVRFQLSTVMGAILSLFWAPVLGLPEPLNPIQILWVAMIMDGPPAVALSLDPARAGIMHEPPRRPEEKLLTLRRLLGIVFFGIVMVAGTLGVLWYGLHSRNPDHAVTMAFTTFVFFQLFNVFNARSETTSAVDANLFRNRFLWISLLAVVVLHIIAVQWTPAQGIFNTTVLSATEWALAIGAAASILVIEEVRKLIIDLHTGLKAPA